MIKFEDILVLRAGYDTYIVKSNGVKKHIVKHGREKELRAYPIVIVKFCRDDSFIVIKDRCSETSEEMIRQVLDRKRDRRLLLIN